LFNVIQGEHHAAIQVKRHGMFSC